ncbi:MAG: peptidylprolyl isomerase, partial [Pseudomonadota bacterium]
REQALAAANSIVEQLSAGAPFEIAAQRFSSAPTAATGGDMGWIVLDDLDEVRQAALQSLPGPGLTQPIIVADGIYIMSIRNRRAPSESTTVVDVTRLTGSEADLQEAMQTISDCSAIDEIADANDGLRAVSLTDLNVNDLGPEGKDMVLGTEIGQATDIFAQSGTLAVMYVCDRRDNVEAVPSRDQIEDRLYSQQLGMISERSLRNLRREATIIRRQ